MSKILLASINAKFIHSNMAIRCLKKYTEQKLDVTVDIAEFTINQPFEIIMRSIYKLNPEVLGLSCYIWNYEYVIRIVREIKKLLPSCIILLGGPEVSYDPQEVIAKTGADVIMLGEGEKSFCDLIAAISSNTSYSAIKGIAYQSDGKTVVTSPAQLVALEEIPFIYDDFTEFHNRIIYYESSRGCPFNCQYCLSSGSGGVRFLTLERVFSDLSKFLFAGVRQVKFVDRTFNCDKNHAMAIFRYLCEHDNFITNFHFEIAAELLDEEMISYLNTARKGLFQLEIGVQSINKETLSAIKRITLPDKLTPIIHGLQKGQNIHLHLDLIAGLPYEGYDSFRASFNYVYSLSPDQLQLGFLKLLKGSGLYAEKALYTLVCTDFAPYEILNTDWLCYDEVLRLKMVEEMVETYYNSGRYSAEICYLQSLFPTPFDFFQALGDYFEEKSFHLSPHSKVEYYDILYGFLRCCVNADIERFKWLCLYDIYAHEKAKKLPDWLDVGGFSKHKDRYYSFIDAHKEEYFSDDSYKDYDTKQLLRIIHLEIFPFDPRELYCDKKETALLFRYASDEIIKVSL